MRTSTILLICFILAIPIVMGAGTTPTADVNCATKWVCDGKICTCPVNKDMAVCDSVISTAKIDTCKAIVPTAAKDYRYPIECLRDKQYCRIDKLDNRDFYLKETKCDRNANPLCDLQYLVEIK